MNNTVLKGLHTIDPERNEFLERDLYVINEHGDKERRRDIVFGVCKLDQDGKKIESESYDRSDFIVDFEGEAKVNFTEAIKMAGYALADFEKQLEKERELHFRDLHKKWENRKKAAEDRRREDANAPLFKEPEPKLGRRDLKGVKLPPYISVVLYYGPGRWTSETDVPSLMKGIPDLKKYVPQFQYQVIAPSTMSNEDLEKFAAGNKQILKALKYQNNTKQLEEAINKDSGFEGLDYTAGMFISAVTGVRVVDEDGNNINKNIKGGKVYMCSGLRGMLKEATFKERQAGDKRAMEAANGAYAKACTIINRLVNGFSEEAICNEFQVTPDDIVMARAALKRDN